MAIENPEVSMPILILAERYPGQARAWHEAVIEKIWSNGKYITVVVGGTSRFVRDRNSVNLALRSSTEGSTAD